MSGETLALIIGIAVVAIALVAGLLTSGRRRTPSVEGRSTDVIAPPRPEAGADADAAIAEAPAAPPGGDDG